MPEKHVVHRAKRRLRSGTRPSTAAGELVREEIRHVREGTHGARSTKQAIAIGLSKARRAGVPLAPPRKGRASARTRASAERAHEVGQGKRKPRSPSRTRSRATARVLRGEPRRAGSHRALSAQARRAAARRTRAERSASARQAARTRRRRVRRVRRITRRRRRTS